MSIFLLESNKRQQLILEEKKIYDLDHIRQALFTSAISKSQNHTFPRTHRTQSPFCSTCAVNISVPASTMTFL